MAEAAAAQAIAASASVAESIARGAGRAFDHGTPPDGEPARDHAAPGIPGPVEPSRPDGVDELPLAVSARIPPENQDVDDQQSSPPAVPLVNVIRKSQLVQDTMLSWLPSPAALLPPSLAIASDPPERGRPETMMREPAEHSPQRIDGLPQIDPELGITTAGETPWLAPTVQDTAAFFASVSRPLKLDLGCRPIMREQMADQEDTEDKARTCPGAKLSPGRREVAQLGIVGMDSHTERGRPEEVRGGSSAVLLAARQRRDAQALTPLAAPGAWDPDVPRERRGSQAAKELRRLLHEERSESSERDDMGQGSPLPGELSQAGSPSSAHCPGRVRFGCVEDISIDSPPRRPRGRSLGIAEGSGSEPRFVKSPASPLSKVSIRRSSAGADLLNGEPSELLRRIRRSFFDRLHRCPGDSPKDNARNPLDGLTPKRGSRLKALPDWMGDLSDDGAQ